ncbi:hypothetical protein [Paenibacillus sp. SN-8-1]|uniref:hypothetical protein n=1 Tax=Paenibacillus sp. SN-8-1 TaxID=3435409 RepID=UPI003D9A94F3
MSMNVTFISPDRRQGLTTVSALTAVALASTQNLTTCLTFTGGDNTSLNTFLGLDPVEDKTRNIGQMVKLLEADAISGNEIADYCTKIPGIPNLQILDSTSTDINSEANDKLIKFAIENMTTDVVITDVTTEIFDEVTKEVIEHSDLVIMVLTQSRDIWKKLKLWEEEQWEPGSKVSQTIMEKLSSKGLLFVFNQYDYNVEAFRDTTKKFGIRHRRCCRISYNSWIKKTSNQGKLHTILPYIISKDPRVIDLNIEIKELLMVILSNLGAGKEIKESDIEVKQLPEKR